MERLALDVLGPLPCTHSGNKYILIVADYFSKWVEAFPMPNQEACTVAELLIKEVVCRFGVPLLIHSDQGRNFESAVFTEMCQLLGIQKIRTTAHHPQSDGMVERFNRTIEDQLAKFVDYPIPHVGIPFCHTCVHRLHSSKSYVWERPTAAC